MWITFWAAVIVFAVFLIVPGFLLFRATGMQSTTALVAAPILTSAAYSILCVVYGVLDVECGWEILFLPLAAIGAVVLLSMRIARATKRRKKPAPAGDEPKDWLVLGAFVAMGILSALIIFVLNIDGADSFVQEYDNVHHFAYIRSFLDSGNWSSIDNSAYPFPAADGTPLNPVVGGGFYPSDWYAFVAMIVDSLDVPIAVAVNAVNFTLAALCWPLGAWLMLRTILGNDRKLLLCGAICTMSFAAFPWKMLYWGPIYPQLASFCMVPAIISMFVLLFSRRPAIAAREDRAIESGSFIERQRTPGFWIPKPVAAIVFMTGLVTLAFLQTNAIFTVAVILLPFCCWRIYAEARERLSFLGTPKDKRAAVTLAAAFAAIACIIWIVIYYSPFMKGVLEFTWTAEFYTGEAIFNLLALSFRQTSAQLLLGALVVLGIIATLKSRRNAWMLVSYLILAIIYLVSVTTDGQIKSYLSGFWYSDAMRLGANLVIVAIPLAALGMRWACRAVYARIAGPPTAGAPRLPRTTSKCVIVILMAAAIFFPNYTLSGYLDITTAFGGTEELIEKAYSDTLDNVYSSEEREFVQQVLEVVEDGAIVLNEPNDGSAFAYGIDGLEVYYRITDGYDEEEETERSATIREGLYRISEDETVQEAASSINARYLLQLDQADWEKESKYLFSYYTDVWEGIDLIDDSTPGFEVVLSSGDMRLYRITAVE